MRHRLLFTVLLVAGGVHAAQGAGETRPAADAFMKCARIAGDAQRLSCYDRLATDLIELGLSNMAVGPGSATTAAPAASTPAASTRGAQATVGAPPVAMNAPPPASSERQPVSPRAAPPANVGEGAAAVATSEQGFGLERVEGSKRSEVKEIRSRYVGEFSGWDGDTVFPLENGQVWQQIESGRMSWRATNPMITIKRGFMGSYVLRVEGVNKTVRVKRVE